jgi:hypothetical protein
MGILMMSIRHNCSGSVLERAGRAILDYGMILVSLWFEGTKFGRKEDQFL